MLDVGGSDKCVVGNMGEIKQLFEVMGGYAQEGRVTTCEGEKYTTECRGRLFVGINFLKRILACGDITLNIKFILIFIIQIPFISSKSILLPK